MAIGVMIIVFLSGRTIREEVMKSKRNFLLLSLVAAVPDLDAVIMEHRTFTHSLVFPTLFFIAGIVAIYIKELKERKIHIILFICGILWLSHIILDAGTGPTAFFWPFLTSLYDIDIIVDANVDGWWIIPYYFSGFSINVTTFNQDDGRDQFISNLTPEERVEMFMDTHLSAIVNIEQLVVHGIIFAFYLYLFYLSGGGKEGIKSGIKKVKEKFQEWFQSPTETVEDEQKVAVEGDADETQQSSEEKSSEEKSQL